MKIKHQEELFFKVLMIVAALIIMTTLIFIIGTVVYKGLPSLSWDMVFKLPGGGFYLGKEGGVLNAIIGSVYIVAGSLFLSLFLSVPVVMYLNFYLRKDSIFANITRFSFDILFGIPSIVYGAFGFALMVYLADNNLNHFKFSTSERQQSIRQIAWQQTGNFIQRSHHNGHYQHGDGYYPPPVMKP